jgi:hypothetical protein
MKTQSIASNSILALTVSVMIVATSVALANEQVKLGDGTTCTVIEATSSTAGGSVSSSTTLDGRTTTTNSGGSSASSSAGSSATSGNAAGQAFSMASATRPDGSVITRRSDGTCDITKPGT